MYQEQAAECMNIPRPTFGRIIGSAHRKIAEALITGKVLRFQKGTVEITKTRKYKCTDCEFEIDVPYETPNLTQCPKCGGEKIGPLNRLHCHRRRHQRGGPRWLR